MKRVFRLPLYFLLAALVLVSAIAYIYYFTTLPETEINNWLRGVTGKNLGLDISFSKVNRDVWNRLLLEGIELSPQSGADEPMVVIPRLELEYDIADLAGGNYRFESLTIDSIFVRWPEEGFKLPEREKKEPGKPSTLTLAFNRISVGAATIVLSDTNIIAIDSLVASFQFDEGNLAVTLSKVIADWPARNTRLLSLTGSIASVDGGYRIDSLAADLGTSRLRADGKVGKSFTRDLDLNVAVSPVDFDDIARLTGVKLQGEVYAEGTLRGSLSDFSGEAAIDGFFFERALEGVTSEYAFSNKILRFDSLNGRLAEADIDGSARFDFRVKPEEYSYSGSVRHLDLRNIGPDLLTDFTGGVHLDGRGFNREQFFMKIDCSLDSVTIDSFYFDMASGPLEFDLKTLRLLPGFIGRYKDTYLAASGSLEYEGNLDITGTAEFDDLTDFTGQTFLEELGGRGQAEFHATGPTQDFSVTASFSSDSAWTYGLFPGHIEISTSLKSFITHRVGWVTGNWTEGLLYSLETDSGFFQATVSGERVFVDSVAVLGPLGSVALVGEYDGTILPPLFSADTVYGVAAGNEFFSRRPLLFRLLEDRTEFERFVMGLGTGTIEVAGSVTNEEQLLDLRVAASGFQIEPIVEQFYRDNRLRGVWWGTANLKGDFEHPVINFDLQIDSLAINDSLLGNLDAIMVYRDGYLHTDSTHLTSDYGEYIFSGNLPMDLSFGEVRTRLPEKPIDFNMTAYGSRLLLAEVFIPTVERFKTDFSVEMNLGGTYSKPTIAGRGTLLNGELKVLDLVNPLTNLRAYVRMNNETIYIDSAMATAAGGEEWLGPLRELIPGRRDARPDQTVRASGIMRLITLGNFAYDIKINGRNFYFEADAYDVRGLADLNLRVIGETVPTVTGAVTLRRLEIRDEFAKFIPPDYDPNIVVEDSTIWNLDLAVSAANNLWIRNNEVDAELKGDLRVERYVGVLTILGTLDFIRGTYNLYGQKFRIKSGSMQYRNVATVDPDIDFTVLTRIRNRSTEGGGPQLTTVEMRITGTLIEPRIDVASGSVLSREDLLRYLVAGSEVNPFGTGTQTDLSGTLIHGLTSTLPTIIPGLSGVGLVDGLEISQTEKGKTEVSLAKYISRSLYVRYSQRLSQESGRTIGVEYYLNDNVSLNVTRSPQVQGTEEHEVISFDLNLNFEF